MDQQSDTRLSFHEGIERWQKRSDTAPMEPVDLAMWPGDAKFENDISDSSLFNERYIESQIGEDELLDNTYLFSMLHIIFCVVVVADLLTNPSFWYFLSLYPVFNAFFFLSLRALARPPQRVRYNRQAQVVQTVDGKGNVVTVPWRSFRPFLRFKLPGRTKLELGFPPPPGNKAKIHEHKGVLWIDGAFDALDDGHIQFASLRFEFIRRYMEDGLDAIQPVPNLSAYEKPSGPPPDRFFYWVGFGFLIDRWAAHHAAKYRWPDEVERLCAEGADLSAYDTTPVASNRSIFYRYDRRAGGFFLCDRDGVQLPPMTSANTGAAARS